MQRIKMAVLVAAALGAIAQAGPLNYIFSGTASGTLGSTPFTNATLTITVPGNSSSVLFLGGSSVQYKLPYTAGTAAFSISGVGSGTFSTAGSINDNQAVFGGSINIYDNNVGLIITIEDSLISQSTFAGYALAAAIGPSSPQATNPSVGDWVNLSTSLGNLTVTSESNVTFQATVGASIPSTPAPPSFYLSMIGLAGIAFYAAPRQRRSAQA